MRKLNKAERRPKSGHESYIKTYLLNEMQFSDQNSNIIQSRLGKIKKTPKYDLFLQAK